jgi:predicted aldo/keto reductase-like oxidoreductase
MMQTRAVGRTAIQLSVVGFGTAQLQMLPERQAVATLARGFELGVNWIHTAPDYGGIDPWIRRAIDQTRRDVMVLSSGPARTKDLPAFFEHTCHIHKTRRLAMYGLAGIEDLEWHGENVWGRGGMVEYLQDRKTEGRLGGIYCSTHASADYVEKLINSGVFDAIMLAWNPLGFHQQSHPWARAKINRDYEDLAEYRERIFPSAAERGVSLLIMKPFAGGMLCRSKALPPHDWYADAAERVDAGDVLRLILEEPAVCAVVPGSTSVEEAEENARAGHAPLFVSPIGRERIARAVDKMRTRLCSRCGKCETTCSQTLSIPAMFRDAYIWTSRNETNQANPTENYFDLHPNATLTCETCRDQTCMCPQGIDIPAALGRIHPRMQVLRATGQHPGPSAAFPERTIEGAHRLLVHTSDVPARVSSRGSAIARFLVQNLAQDQRWTAPQHTPDRKTHVGIGVMFDDRISAVVPLRNTVCPGEVSPFAFEFRAPAKPGRHEIAFCLMPLHQKRAQERTVFFAGTVTVDPKPSLGMNGHRLPRRVARFVRSQMRKARGQHYAASTNAVAGRPAYGVEYQDHSFPHQMKAGVTYGIRLTLANSGGMTWHADPPDGHRVDVQVFLDDARVSTLRLPRPTVARVSRSRCIFRFAPTIRKGRIVCVSNLSRTPSRRSRIRASRLGRSTCTSCLLRRANRCGSSSYHASTIPGTTTRSLAFRKAATDIPFRSSSRARKDVVCGMRRATSSSITPWVGEARCLATAMMGSRRRSPQCWGEGRCSRFRIPSRWKCRACCWTNSRRTTCWSSPRMDPTCARSRRDSRASSRGRRSFCPAASMAGRTSG